jgi:hypothetical protein
MNRQYNMLGLTEREGQLGKSAREQQNLTKEELFRDKKDLKEGKP